MSVNVIYSTECFMDQRSGEPGRQSEPVPFASPEEAKTAPLPDGYTFGIIQDETGTARYSYSERFGWSPCDEP